MLNELVDRAFGLPEDVDVDVEVEAWEAVLTHPDFGGEPTSVRWSTLVALGLSRMLRYDRDGRLEDLAGALTCMEAALTLPDIPSTNRTAVSFNLAKAQERRYRLTNDTDDLLSAARTMWALVDDPPPGTSSRAICIWVGRLIEGHAGPPTRPMLWLTNAVLERMVEDPNDPDDARNRLALAGSLTALLFDISPSTMRSTVARALQLATESEQLLPDGPVRRAAAEQVVKLRGLAAFMEENPPPEPGRTPREKEDLFGFFEKVAKIPDRGTRISRLRAARAANPYETNADAWVLLSLVLAEAILSLRTNAKIDTDEAITVLRSVLDLPETRRHGHVPVVRHNLAIAYSRRQAGDPGSNTTQALNTLEPALSELAQNDPLRATFALTLAGLLRDASEQTRNAAERQDHIERAITLCHTALDTTRDDGEARLRARVLNLLAQLLRVRATGDAEQNIEEAIAAARQAVGLLDPVADIVPWGDAHHTLGNLYQDRLTEGREANLWRAIEHYRASLEAQPKDTMPVDWALSQIGLGNAYSLMRGRDTEATQQLAVKAYMDAVSILTIQGQPREWAQAEASLGMALGDPEVRARPDLNRAITHLTSSLEVFTEDAYPTDWARVQRCLGLVREQIGGPAQLAAAARHFRSALRVLSFENQPRQWATVQLALWQLEPAQDRAAYENTIRLLIDNGLRSETFTASIAQLRFFRFESDWPAAADAAQRAAELHETLYQEALLRSTRHMEQRGAAQLVPEIVTTLCAAGRVMDGVLLLERTRARELGEVMRQDRDSTRMARDADPDAYAAYREADERLVRLVAVESSLVGARFGMADLEVQQSALVRAIAKARSERDSALAPLLAAVDPLDQVDIRELAFAAPSHRPLVYVYTFQHIAYLLLLRWDGRGGHSIEARSADGSDLASGEGTDAVLHALAVGTLAQWLRELEVEEVTLVACGRLSGVPLHAVPYEGRCLIDDFAVSFAPSAAALAHRPSPEPGPRSLVAVGDPTGDLGFASAEATAVTTLSGWDRYILRQGTAATASVFMEEDLPGATHVHLACHGLFDPAGPLESAFIMAGGTRMTLRTITKGRAFRDVRLVFASACGTASTDGFLPDEAIGLASGLLQAGAAEVIATLWNVQDLPAMLLATRFYHELPAGPIQALRAAQLWLRDSTPPQLSLWCSTLLAAVHDEPARARLRRAVTVLDGFPQQAPCYADPRHWAPFIHLGA
ncbi:CHAT domain-containing protein [Streptomyces sp. NPDC059443]|uniref:CHAT domain-containing protein n=1 Tax=unclassified Streptomyces TaxID=2593676 RepID=UPI0036B25C27